LRAVPVRWLGKEFWLGVRVPWGGGREDLRDGVGREAVDGKLLGKSMAGNA